MLIGNLLSGCLTTTIFVCQSNTNDVLVANIIWICMQPTFATSDFNHILFHYCSYQIRKIKIILFMLCLRLLYIYRKDIVMLGKLAFPDEKMSVG